MKVEYEQIRGILKSLGVIKNKLKGRDQGALSEQERDMIKGVKDCAEEINLMLFKRRQPSCSHLTETAEFIQENLSSINKLCDELDQWIQFIEKTVEKREKNHHEIDNSFDQFCDYIRFGEYREIVDEVTAHFIDLKSQNPELGEAYEIYYSFYKEFWGSLNIRSQDYEVIEQRVKVLKEHLDDFVWLYQTLMDYRSKCVLFGIIKNWLSFDVSILEKIKEYNFLDYFDLDLIACDKEEVFVDLGAYTGDSVLNFIRTFPEYKKIYCYEITPESIEKLKLELSEYPNIEIREKGVGAERGNLFLKKFGIGGSSNQVDKSGNIPIEVVTLDEDITDKITFLKMDIEGSEQNALLGAREHIKRDHPKLAICTYHNNEDIWKIPRMIQKIDDSYQFYMRYNGKQIGPTEYVLFAL